MSMILISSHGYRLGLASPLDNHDIELLVRSFDTPAMKSSGILKGRGDVVRASLKTDSVIIKPYRRGGLIRHFNKDTFLKTGKIRAQDEYDTLMEIRLLGIPAPAPVAWAYTGTLWYKCWLVTKEIPHDKSLADLKEEDHEILISAVQQTASYVNVLIDHGYYHTDLHPGNVLLDKQGRIHLIDFDKCLKNRKDKEISRHRYIQRWKRAVHKYTLPSLMAETFEQTLANVKA